MKTQRANASVIAILVIILVIAGVLYLFYQNRLATDVPVEETTEETTMEVPAPDADESVEEMVVEESEDEMEEEDAMTEEDAMEETTE